MDATAVADIVKDTRYGEYVCGAWLTAAREFGPAATAGIEQLLYTASGDDPFTPPVFTAPALPNGVVAVAPGLLDRIFLFVQSIKANPKCTDPIALQLGIVGQEDAEEYPLPTFTLKQERDEAARKARREK